MVMKANTIPPNREVCGKTWATWTAMAAKHYGQQPTMDQVRHYIALHEHESHHLARVLRNELPTDIEKDILLLEARWTELLRTKYSHLKEMYQAGMKTATA